VEAYVVDWLNLLVRWVHFVTGVAWIGASFYFIWLDNHLEAPKESSDSEKGVGGELWSVHGGGFYHAQKYRVAPRTLPATLHWFKWEAYSTWLSGMFLLALVYWYGATVYLVDPGVAALSPTLAVALAAAFIVGGWVVYDLLCKSPLGRHETTFAAVLFVLVALLAWGLCQLFSGRGAYIHFGAVLGTIMVANVFFVIIPGQRRMVEAAGRGELPSADDGIRAKQRSVHNTYFTLPVLFVMTSNHYATTYNHAWNWAILVAITLAGALIRVYFVARHKGSASPVPLVVAGLLLAGVAVAIAPRVNATPGGAVAFADPPRLSRGARRRRARNRGRDRCRGGADSPADRGYPRDADRQPDGHQRRGTRPDRSLVSVAGGPLMPDTRYPRDLRGYGQHPPDPVWPDNARIAVQFVVNYEEGAENCVLHGDSASEAFLSEIVGAEPVADQRHMNMESLYEYGARAGFWRLYRMFTGNRMPVTVFGVAMALERNPEAVDAMQDAGWEIASHGYRWIDYQHVDEDTERLHLGKAIEIHTRVTGERPLGWYLGRCSPRTHRLVAEEGGFVYNADSYADDLPYWDYTFDRPQLMVPYTLDANDMRFATAQGFNSGQQFFDYLKDAFDVLYAEGSRMMSVGLHCRLAGRPGRAAALARFLDYVADHDDVWVARRIDIARHWRKHFPAET
jgi:putative urate catabolism protein